MRYFFLIFFIGCVQQLKATNYYFSSTTGDDSRSASQAQQPATPWSSIGKLNAIFGGLSAGDSIFFKRGDVFHGSINATRSGNASQPIVFAAYGEGAKPVITGLTRITDWTSSGANVYETTLGLGTRLNILLVNGEAKVTGRFPNSTAANKGYLNFETTSGNNQITDNELPGFPDWTGGEVVIRKNRWVIDRNLITRHAGTNIYYNTASPNAPSPRYGYFIQNHPKALDLHGEWYHNLNNKKLGMFFTGGNPSSATVQAATINTLVSVYNQTDLSFIDLRFTGANQSAFEVHQSQRVSIINCDILHSGTNAITSTNTGYLRIEGNLIEHTNNIAIHHENTFNSTIRANTIRNTGMIAGMGKDDSGSYEAVMLTGDNHLIERNIIEHTGYIPITFRGNSNIIRNNYINVFSAVKDDGSGVYSWNNIAGAPASFGSKIISNVILNGVGAGEGTDNPAYLAANGIYMDDNSANVEITGNTVANMPLHGIYIHNAHEITITNNTLFNNGSQLALIRDDIAPNSPVRNINMQQNIFFSKEVAQPAAEFKTHENDLNLFGSFDNNYYARPLNDNFTIHVGYSSNGTYINKALNLDEWKRLHGKDLSSKQSPASITSKDQIKFEYNPTATQQTIALDKVYIDVKNNSYSGSVKLEPFSSIILIPKTDPTPGTELCPSTGSILREQWDNIAGNDISKIPVNSAASSSSNINRFETVQMGDNYAARIRGYICPPVTGDYTFYLSGDDAVELWLSTDANPANKKKIAGILSYTDYNEWSKFPGQTSAKMALKAGQRYYIEALHKEGGGGDHITVAWQLPDGTREMPIPGNRLSPFGGLLPEPEPLPQPQPEPLCSSTGTVLRELWLNVTGTNISDIPLTRLPSGSTTWNGLQTINIGDHYAERLRGYVCAPQTGNYIFSVSGDDAVELWLSTDEQATNKKKIAFIEGYTLVNEWNKYSSQNSTAIYLRAGQRYYIEALHKEGGGGDHLTVSWQLPDGKNEIPVAASRLSPFVPEPVVEQPQSLCSATGSILRQQWDNISGNDVSNIPLTMPPTRSAEVTSLQTNAVGDNYGARFSGYICPPQTGNYIFYLSGDDAAELWLSTDEFPASKRKISSLLSYTGLQEYNKFTSQTSAQVTLQAGKKYYIEVLHKEGGGGDHVTVAWQLPDGQRESPIPGSRLSPYAAAALPPLPSPPAITCTATGSVLMEQWLNVAGSNVADIPLGRSPDKTSSLTRLQTYDMGDRYGVRIRGYVCAPTDGNYIFSVSGDDAVELWLSTDEDPSHKIKLVSLLSYTNFQEWSKYPSQHASPVVLKAGKRYYFEVLQKEGDGGDHISIGWRLPDNKSEFPIAENRLSPYIPTGMNATSNNRQGNELYQMEIANRDELQAYPSPFHSTATIRVTPSSRGKVKLELYDIHGKLVKKVFSGMLESGTVSNFILNGNELAKGVYIIRLVTPSQVINKKITYSK